MSADRPVFEDRPHAKINLTLEVVGRRPDGYHELRSTFVRIGLSDLLTMSPGGLDGTDTLTVTGLHGAPTRHNLVTRALDALRARVAIPLPTLDVTLDKAIPAAAGLGGGSSDCASAIRLAQACWGISLAAEDELALALGLGSDVPFFLSGAATAVIEGVGELVTPTAAISEAAALLVSPPIPLWTASVFNRFDQLSAAGSGRDPHNDLWPAAASLALSLPGLRAALESHTNREWRMSGSGPTLFTLYPSVAEAVAAGKSLAVDPAPELEGCLINAVDFVGPDPAWRYP